MKYLSTIISLSFLMYCSPDYTKFEVMESLLKDKIEEDGDVLYSNKDKVSYGSGHYTARYVYRAEYTKGATYIIHTNTNNKDNLTFPYYSIVNYKIKWYANDEFVNFQTIVARYFYQVSTGTWLFNFAIRKAYNSSKYNTDPDDIIWVTNLLGYQRPNPLDT